MLANRLSKMCLMSLRFSIFSIFSVLINLKVMNLQQQQPETQQHDIIPAPELPTMNMMLEYDVNLVYWPLLLHISIKIPEAKWKPVELSPKPRKYEGGFHVSVVTQLFLLRASFNSTKWRCLTSIQEPEEGFCSAFILSLILRCWLYSTFACLTKCSEQSTVLNPAAARISMEAVTLHGKIMVIRPAELTGAPAARSSLTGREVIHF